MKPAFFPENIKGALQHRLDQAAEKNNKFIDIAPEFYDLIMGTMTMSKSKKICCFNLCRQSRSRCSLAECRNEEAGDKKERKGRRGRFAKKSVPSSGN